MKKLLVIPIIGAYYMLMTVLFPIELLLICIIYVAEFMDDIANKVSIYYEDYIMKPAQRIYSYALRIMHSDKILQHINEASERLKQGNTAAIMNTLKTMTLGTVDAPFSLEFINQFAPKL